MYAFLRGQLIDAGPPTVIDCGGVGYEVSLPERDVLRLPAVGSAVRVHTHLQVREDDHSLFGFLQPQDREIFRNLISVSGVGPKVALAVLGQPDAERVLRGVAAGDPTPLTQVKGIGRKTAERLVMELKDRAAAWTTPEIAVAAASGASDDDATLALISMGISPERARAAMARIDESDRTGLGVEELVRRALRHAV